VNAAFTARDTSRGPLVAVGRLHFERASHYREREREREEPFYSHMASASSLRNRLYPAVMLTAASEDLWRLRQGTLFPVQASTLKVTQQRKVRLQSSEPLLADRFGLTIREGIRAYARLLFGWSRDRGSTAKIVLFSRTSRRALGPTQHPVQWVTGALFLGNLPSSTSARTPGIMMGVFHGLTTALQENSVIVSENMLLPPPF
jgi:hypothetical protein